MLNVFITVDTEIWCNGWNDLDGQFAGQFRKYVYGPTKQGNYALPAKLSILKQFGLKATFFVEPLFSARFGLAPLEEIVGLIQQENQEVQLHLHSEWVDEVGDELLTGVHDKLPNLTCCDRQQQSQLVAYGLNRLKEAGAKDINAFRAGSYGANLDTLRALADNHLKFDTSYNLAGSLSVADIAPGEQLTQPRKIENVYEYPVSVFRDQSGRGVRHLQVTACSYRELVYCLNMASNAGWDSVVIVTHNFELLNPLKTRADTVVVNRFKRLCKFLDRNRDRFNVTGFTGLSPREIDAQPSILESKAWLTALRAAEQGVRRILFG